MSKFVKFLIGLFLLPLSVAALPTLSRVLRASGEVTPVWVALVAGMACWVVVFLLLPKPMWVYVFGHELTHALWTWAFGGRVKKFKVTAKGGHVIITKTNFFISLAPYFFPLYAVCVAVFFLIGDLIWNWHRYQWVFHFLLGAAYAFHVTLTLFILRTRQSDITDHGWFFSIVVIWLGNFGTLLLALPILIGQPSLGDALSWWLIETGQLVQRVGRVF
ncbi:MAG: hypothetical protein DVB32_04435 [Verrucomicrobia bacterium]|nr:MAG: hypothetical protein DVB32_04435 [Verrucomicrobiota bacterium]